MSFGIPIVMGCYTAYRNGAPKEGSRTPGEIPLSFAANPGYRDAALFYAGDEEAAELLVSHGVRPYRVMSDAPRHVLRDTVHRMKHWMCREALAEFGEILWLDWDTVQLCPLDEDFAAYCRRGSTPKFIYIPNYRWGVNCGVYYANADWLEAVDRSFENPHFNDEVLWTSVLPEDHGSRPEFWLGDLAVNVSDLHAPDRVAKEPGYTERQLGKITADTRFVHLRRLEQAADVREAYAERRREAGS